MNFLKRMKFSIKTLLYVKKNLLFWDSEISGISKISKNSDER